MEYLRVKLLNDDATVPSRGSSGAVGYDMACIEDFLLDTQSYVLVSTGIAIQLPTGVYGRVAPRSGLTVKHGVHIGAGVIDPDYMGEIKVAMFNLGLKPVEFKKGDRIAQLILERCEVPDVIQVDELVTTQRGEGGFGSTGK